eukprot:GHVN01024859.1.p1 GENE.GHVN01024859.1~~GHVN01024859.1.p1  ORF type:complete len:154 (+),score=6.34 GHVN01024859.1:2-463(+)
MAGRRINGAKRKTRKSRKLRGHVSAGHGRVGKHRKHPGGVGNAGSMKHHKSNILKYHPHYFGKKGRVQHGLQRDRIWKREIGVEFLLSLVPLEDKKMLKDGYAPVVNLIDHGYTNVVIGRGELFVPLIVRARSFTEEAENKIREVGGICQLAA